MSLKVTTDAQTISVDGQSYIGTNVKITDGKVEINGVEQVGKTSKVATNVNIKDGKVIIRGIVQRGHSSLLAIPEIKKEMPEFDNWVDIDESATKFFVAEVPTAYNANNIGIESRQPKSFFKRLLGKIKTRFVR